MYKKIVGILICMMLVGTSVLVLNPIIKAGTTVYANNRSGWESDVGSYDEEFFTDATLNPGVSVVTDLGYVDTIKGVWWDRLIEPSSGETTTTWQFATPIVGFGGYWDTATPGGPGTSIEVEIDGSWMTVGEIPNSYTGQFWGFVSTTSFSSVRLSSGSTSGAWCETYELDNMVYSTGGNQAPNAEAGGPYAGFVGYEHDIIFSASQSSDPNGDPLQYRWDFNNDGMWDTSWLTNPDILYVYNFEYNGLVKLEVTDGEKTTSGTATVDVNYSCNFAHLTDLHVNPFNAKDWEKVLQKIRSLPLTEKPKFILCSGDLVDLGADNKITNKLPLPYGSASYYKLISYINSPNPDTQKWYLDADFKIPILFCPGNHDSMWKLDYKSSINSIENYKHIIQQNLYYKEKIGNCYIFSLFSGNNTINDMFFWPKGWPEGDGIDSTYIDQLIEDLDAIDELNNGKDESNYIKIIFLHHPYINPVGTKALKEYSIFDGTFMDIESRIKFYDLCKDYKVHYVVSGHLHRTLAPYTLDGKPWSEGSGTQFLLSGSVIDDQYYRLLPISPDLYKFFSK